MAHLFALCCWVCVNQMRIHSPISHKQTFICRYSYTLFCVMLDTCNNIPTFYILHLDIYRYRCYRVIISIMASTSSSSSSHASVHVSGVKRRREVRAGNVDSRENSDDDDTDNDDHDNASNNGNGHGNGNDTTGVIGMVDEVPTMDDLLRRLQPAAILRHNRNDYGNDNDIDDHSETGQSLVVNIERESESKTRTKSGRAVRVTPPTVGISHLLIQYIMCHALDCDESIGKRHKS
jgi:hypothetical protein